jgi:hypothetical protein
MSARSDEATRTSETNARRRSGQHDELLIEYGFHVG